MPWVVQDDESEELNLANCHLPRPVQPPIGALEPNRLKSVKQRYEEMVSLNGPEMIPFMWGSHYSTSGYVLYYLAREAPDLMLKLQSGDFDKPDRLFSSIGRAWKGVLENPMDVKELILNFIGQPLVLFSPTTAALTGAALQLYRTCLEGCPREHGGREGTDS
jgi:factor associated with neutral sphingomyelinase activation